MEGTAFGGAGQFPGRTIPVKPAPACFRAAAPTSNVLVRIRRLVPRTQTMLHLEAGPTSARIVPEAGGLVAALDWRAPDGRRHALLHAPPGATPGTASPNLFGCWAMLPFANRAFDSVVDDGELRFPVPANDPAGTIHGFGWQAAWQVDAHRAGHTVLGHRRSEGPDPYRYVARQEIRLDPAGMTITISLTNEADRALPYGFGLHPWFPCARDTRLRMSAGRALVLGPGYRATGARDLPDGGPYATGGLFASSEETAKETAWSFLDWDGAAEIATPSTGLAIRLTASTTLRAPVVWAPASASFLCVEPQSHAIGSPSEAAARRVSPLTRLAPGETLSGWMRIEAAVLGR